MAPLLKNLYNKEYIQLLSQNIKHHYVKFHKENFQASIFNKEWEGYELKNRMRHISTTLGNYLPDNYKEALDILTPTFSRMNHAYGLENMIFQDFVAVYGLEYFELSMPVLAHFTIGSSSEFAIREFIMRYEGKTMQQMLQWAKSPNEHIRRLASEGSRPRLPWAISLPVFKDNPQSVLNILEILKDDISAYVRKSVANNLNDISKDNPKYVKTFTKKHLGFSKERDTLLKHACRTMLKASDKEVLALFGFTKVNHIILKNFKYNQNVKMGEEFKFSFLLQSYRDIGKVRIEFTISFLRKNQKHNKKVFQISEGFYKEQNKTITKSYSFRPISTRVYYKGEHKLSILLNGLIFKEVSFFLY